MYFVVLLSMPYCQLDTASGTLQHIVVYADLWLDTRSCRALSSGLITMGYDTVNR